MNNICSNNLQIGVGTVIEPTAQIRGINGKARNIWIGDHCYIGSNVQIICDEFSLGDYGKIHHDSNIHGYKPCEIGHNAWIGQFTLIDSIGGCTIGNNCGIGASSQLWSHIKFGDTLEGCKFLSKGPLRIGNDVWFVGHCIVSPITAEDKSMALAGSVLTRDMKFNTIYSGVPAKALEKLGGQFVEVSLIEKFQKMLEFQELAGLINSRVKVVTTREDISDDGNSYFVIQDRKYTKRGNPEEVVFMKYLLPEKAKFVPY